MSPRSAGRMTLLIHRQVPISSLPQLPVVEIYANLIWEVCHVQRA